MSFPRVECRPQGLLPQCRCKARVRDKSKVKARLLLHWCRCSLKVLLLLALHRWEPLLQRLR